MKDNILKLFEQVTDKRGFVQLAADDLGRSAYTIRNQWFGGFKIIPDSFQPRLLELLQNWISNQNKSLQSIEVKSPHQVQPEEK